MDYNKITINISPFEEWPRNVLMAQLGEIGFDSFVETETGFEAFISIPQFDEEDLNFVLNSYQEDFTFSVKSEIIKSENWNEVWEENDFQPLHISNECVIRAPFTPIIQRQNTKL